MLTLSFITGTEPDKWFRRFRDRTSQTELKVHASDDPLAELIRGEVVLALTRIPDSRLDDTYHVVRLYQEQVGVAFPSDHPLNLLDAVTPAELDGEIVHTRYTEALKIEEIRTHLHTVAANVGVVIAPRPMLKALSGARVAHRPLIESETPPTTIALVWLKSEDSDDIQDFVGIAKGRTSNSSRHTQPQRSAQQKARDKAKRRLASKRVPAKHNKRRSR
ncbi:MULTISPECIES: LysR family transcriptional regulator substrate-binding protein [unclassified Corynebacterium]|uniref:LysR family transcriptional regulator substrate-binding protein n=1 Tax=unclassified Corynebacterium TaxID=2624378 RepID=UPI002169AB9C|nr:MULTISPECIES: LysR family transcriptional regulator substrate-binding protein [unclassified Corynebacterium]MCS4491706.1 LysR family transcriptional regulator substrate-binding protein [Corynebacterium sp. ES2715-CONJ3]MCS4531811.1 LysR family transcriptional regulator substrate-binding protein [Corynebacterium sp. ES2730-CONJ]